jgi:hypothetical protein
MKRVDGRVDSHEVLDETTVESYNAVRELLSDDSYSLNDELSVLISLILLLISILQSFILNLGVEERDHFFL